MFIVFNTLRNLLVATMNIRCLRLFAFFLCTFSGLDAVVIVIHGGVLWGASRTWWMPQGKFFQEIERQAACFGEAVVPFGWSGNLTVEHVTNAGNALAKLILSYPRHERITVIAHSLGGNVVNKASIALYDPVAKMLGGISSKPVRDALEAAYIALEADHPMHTSASYVCPLPVPLYGGFDYTYTLREVPGLKAAIEAFRGSPAFKKKNIIDRAIYLGTPVDELLYAPQMDVIGSLINMYSHGDRIQKVGGLFDRRYKGHEHISNIQVLVKSAGSKLPHAPSHSAIHAPYIGRWLLLMPEVLAFADITGNNFKQFAFGKDGLILFDETTGPRFFPQPEAKRYLQGLVEMAKIAIPKQPDSQLILQDAPELDTTITSSNEANDLVSPMSGLGLDQEGILAENGAFPAA